MTRDYTFSGSCSTATFSAIKLPSSGAVSPLYDTRPCSSLDVSQHSHGKPRTSFADNQPPPSVLPKIPDEFSVPMIADATSTVASRYASNLIFTLKRAEENAKAGEAVQNENVPQLPPIQHSGVTEWTHSDNHQGPYANITVLTNSDDEYDESTGSLHNASSQHYVNGLVFDTDEDSTSSMTQMAAALPPMADAASGPEDGYLPVFGGAANAGTEVEEMNSGGFYCGSELIEGVAIFAPLVDDCESESIRTNQANCCQSTEPTARQSVFQCG